MPRCEIENTKARHPAMSRLSNIIVIHSKLLISTTLHEHGTESQSDGGEDNRAEECDCEHSSIFLFVSTFVFSHCKDRPFSRTLQVFFSLFASDIATPPAYSDKYWEHPLFLSRRINFCSFFTRYCTSKRNGASATNTRNSSGRRVNNIAMSNRVFYSIKELKIQKIKKIKETRKSDTRNGVSLFY